LDALEQALGWLFIPLGALCDWILETAKPVVGPRIALWLSVMIPTAAYMAGLWAFFRWIKRMRAEERRKNAKRWP
jgi:hypothetical protein